MVGYVGQDMTPLPKPVPPPFRTWEEYRAAMGKDKDRRLSHEEKMAGAPQAHAKVKEEIAAKVSFMDTAVELEVQEEEQRKVWTREATAKAVAAAMAARTCRYVADGICRKECGKVCKFMQFDPPADVVEVVEVSASKPPYDTRSSILDEAKGLVTGARNQAYDAPEQNFTRIARHWSVYMENRFFIKIDIRPADVALMMDLMKTARLEFNIGHKDSWVDKVGYSACGAECALNPGE